MDHSIRVENHLESKGHGFEAIQTVLCVETLGSATHGTSDNRHPAQSQTLRHSTLLQAVERRHVATGGVAWEGGDGEWIRMMMVILRNIMVIND